MWNQSESLEYCHIVLSCQHRLGSGCLVDYTHQVKTVLNVQQSVDGAGQGTNLASPDCGNGASKVADFLGDKAILHRKLEINTENWIGLV